MTATYICTKLNGSPARFAGDPLLQSQTRSFALWTASDDTYRPVLASTLKATCGIVATIETAKASSDTSATPARLRQKGITTVVIDASTVDLPVATQQSTEVGYFPEWMVTGKPWLRLDDVNYYARLADQNQWRHAFGITTDYRRDGTHDQFWYRAYHEGCPDCAEPGAVGFSESYSLYDQFNLLFRAVQAAGPHLTPQNVDKGMHAIPPNGSADPYKPAAYMAPGNYTYVKDAMAIWWDPSGVTPGNNTAGCYRLPEGGRRYRANEWKPGDGDLFNLTGPDACQGDPFQT